MFGKHGNFKASVPDISKEKFVLQDQYEKGLISETEFKTAMNKLSKAQLMFIAKTNGGLRPKSKGRPKYNLTERKDMHTQQLLSQAEVEEDSKVTEINTEST